MVSMRVRTRALVAWWLWLTTLGFCAAGLAVTLVVTRPLTAAVLVDGAAFALVFPLGYATIGLVLGLRRPDNPIGWLFAASGLVWSLTIPLDPWVDQLVLDHRPLPLVAQLGALVGEFNWAPAVALGITLPALLVPDGRLRSPRWRPVAAAAVIGPVLGLVGGSLAPGQLQETGPHRQPVRAGRGRGHGGGGGRLHRPGAVADQHGGRPGVRWCCGSGPPGGPSASSCAGWWPAPPGAVAGLLVGIAGVVMTYFAVLCVPAGVAVAVLRYRLWDLDRLVSRTVTYTLVTALLVIPYLLVVPTASKLVEGSGSLAVAAATLTVAALFQPLRRRVQELVDRRFNRRRYDATRTVEGFAARLRDQVDLDALNRELLAVVDQTMQPTRTSLWLRAQ